MTAGRAGAPPPEPPAAPRLEQLYVNLTDGCNQACRHCWIDPPPPGRQAGVHMLDLALLRGVLGEALPLGLRAVKLSGGEPLLHPALGQVLDLLEERGLALNLETNGLRVDRALARRLAAMPRRFISVSLDAVDPALNDRIRGVPGSADRARAAVGLLAEAGLGPQIVMSVMRCNAGQVAPMVKLAQTLGAASVKFNLVQPTARGAALHSRGEALGVAELIALGRQVEGALSRSTPLQLLFDHPMAFRSLSRIARIDGRTTCALPGIMGLLADGRYAMCAMGGHAPALVYGRAGEDALASLWREHPVLRQLRAGLPQALQGVCGRCLMRGACIGACIAQSFYRTGQMWAPYWFCEQAEQAGLFPPSRLASPRPGQGDPGGAGAGSGPERG